jgi:rhodanese-related sulfurtransferase
MNAENTSSSLISGKRLLQKTARAIDRRTSLVLTNYADVTVAEAKAMIDSDLHLVVLDVRTMAEYGLAHLRSAKLIPVGELVKKQNELNKSEKILVYCRLGVRSRRASKILADSNFHHVHNMLGGITAWIEAGFPVYPQQSSFKQAIVRLRARFRRLPFEIYY